MEIEKFFSGYCRQLDSARVVEVILEDGDITEVDCCYGSCAHEASCPIAQQIADLKQ